LFVLHLLLPAWFQLFNLTMAEVRLSRAAASYRL
jgi:hypothetical protein